MAAGSYANHRGRCSWRRPRECLIINGIAADLCRKLCRSNPCRAQVDPSLGDVLETARPFPRLTGSSDSTAPRLESAFQQHAAVGPMNCGSQGHAERPHHLRRDRHLRADDAGLLEGNGSIIPPKLLVPARGDASWRSSDRCLMLLLVSPRPVFFRLRLLDFTPRLWRGQR